MEPTLRDKFYGCIAASHIGSAMGAAVEGMIYQRIEEKYGFVEDFLPYEHYGNGWLREPGTTEDGIERQKLMIFAIEKKGGRVNAEDVRASWLANMNPNAAGLVSEPFEGTLRLMALSGIPARDIGRHCDYAGLNSFARACHPVGLINAGNIETAIEDALEVGQLYQTTNSRGLKWACVTAICIAAAVLPGATVESVIKAVTDNCDRSVSEEIGRELCKTEKIKHITELRKYFDGVYNGYGIPYSQSSANEVVTKAVAIFKMVNGNAREAVIAGVNMGRDTDCVAAIAGGISGALTGASSLRDSWITQLDYASSVNPHTCSKRTAREHSDALYAAFKKRIEGEAAYARLMDIE